MKTTNHDNLCCLKIGVNVLIKILIHNIDTGVLLEFCLQIDMLRMEVALTVPTISLPPEFSDDFVDVIHLHFVVAHDGPV